MRYLFYIVHPSKVHLFKDTINKLKDKHTVDLLINSKDVLEDLIISEGWNYSNLFPYGRNNSSKPSLIKSALKFLLTIFKLEKYLFNNKRYDMFITDDSLVVNGKMRGVPTYLFNDNDIKTIKAIKILFYFSDKIISPYSTDLGKFNSKKIPFYGNKAVAHLHPKYFLPNPNIKKNKFCIIRLAKLNATHDIKSNNGITDNDLENIVNLIDNKFEIIILSERKIPNKYNDYLFKDNPHELMTFLYNAEFLISDSGTMATEAAILGVPNILINKLAKDIGVHKELYDAGLQFYFDSYSDSFSTIKKFIFDDKTKLHSKNNKMKYIDKCDDINKLMYNLFTNNEDVK
tara:strand:- start:688 stop:1722 length:1035 start_codon:yes stop_codon:yes gene_type:complete